MFLSIDSFHFCHYIALSFMSSFQLHILLYIHHSTLPFLSLLIFLQFPYSICFNFLSKFPSSVKFIPLKGSRTAPWLARYSSLELILPPITCLCIQECLLLSIELNGHWTAYWLVHILSEWSNRQGCIKSDCWPYSAKTCHGSTKIFMQTLIAWITLHSFSYLSSSTHTILNYNILGKYLANLHINSLSED